jgi:hypothetical protein
MRRIRARDLELARLVGRLQVRLECVRKREFWAEPTEWILSASKKDVMFGVLHMASIPVEEFPSAIDFANAMLEVYAIERHLRLKLCYRHQGAKSQFDVVERSFKEYASAIARRVEEQVEKTAKTDLSPCRIEEPIEGYDDDVPDADGKIMAGLVEQGLFTKEEADALTTQQS